MDGRIANENNNEDEVFLNNNVVGENLTSFCGHQRWRATMKTSCNERVQYITKRYGMSDQEARISIMKNKDCICDSRDFGGDIGSEVVTALEDKKSGYIGSNTTSLSLSGLIIASIMMLMLWIFSSSGRHHSRRRISYRTVRLFMYFILAFLTPVYIISMFELANKHSIYSTTSSFQNTGINRLVVSSKFNVDILSVASIKQLNLLNAQRSTITSHKSVRNFFNATELDDADPDCHKDITWDHVDAASKFCRKRSRYMSPVYRYLRGNYANSRWLKKKKNPAGWLCAQVRPYSGLMKAYLHYKASGEALPDYFLIFDDDTYYNMELFQRTFEDNDSATAKVYAGCLVRFPIHMTNFTFPFGGFGSIISKGALRKLFQGIRCHGLGEDSTNATTVTDVTPQTEDEAALCRRLKEDNVGELKYFTSGMNLVELMYRYSSTERYRDVFKWTSGFCMHSVRQIGARSLSR